MSGRFMDRSQTGFVYTAYAEKPWDIEEVEGKTAYSCLLADAQHYEICINAYSKARDNGCTKQDARKNLPVAQATGTYVYMNSSSLRQFFNERLRPAAEWEIRRMAQMMFDIVYAIAPSHFEDFKIMLDGE